MKEAEEAKETLEVPTKEEKEEFNDTGKKRSGRIREGRGSGGLGRSQRRRRKRQRKRRYSRLTLVNKNFHSTARHRSAASRMQASTFRTVASE